MVKLYDSRTNVNSASSLLTLNHKMKPLLVSQLAPKYPWRQRHSLGLTHTSFSLQVKLPSQRAWVDRKRYDETTVWPKMQRDIKAWYIRVRHSFPSCAHPPQHTSPDDLEKQLWDWKWEGNPRPPPETDGSCNWCGSFCKRLQDDMLHICLACVCTCFRQLSRKTRR